LFGEGNGARVKIDFAFVMTLKGTFPSLLVALFGGGIADQTSRCDNDVGIQASTKHGLDESHVLGIGIFGLVHAI
jgi:hypothetical protein